MSLRKIKLKGVTLVEILLYVALVSVFSLVVMAFFVVITETNSKFTVTEEVENEAINLMGTLDMYISNSTAVTGLTAGTSANNIVLTSSIASSNPTTFRLNSGALQIQEGAAGTFTNLSSNKVTMSNLTFFNYAQNSSLRHAVRYQFTLTNTFNQKDTYTKTFYGSALLR